MGQREEWARGRSGPEGGVGQREEWARGRCGPEGGVGQREERARGRSGPSLFVVKLLKMFHNIVVT